MKPAILELMEEHKLIMRMLSALQGLCTQLHRGGPVEPGDLSGAVDFIADFADHNHHAKEEDLLFPAMEKAGMPPTQGPVAVMLEEHTQGRALAAAMREAARRYAAKEPTAAAAFIQAAAAYANLLNQHISKEDHCLYPMALEAVPDAEWDTLAVQFAEVEKQRMGPVRRQDYIRLIERLERAYCATPA